MSEFQPWEWPTDEVPVAKIVPFSRSLDGHPVNWESLVFAGIDPASSHIRLRPAGSNDLFCLTDAEGNVGGARLSRSLDSWQVRMVCAYAFTHAKIARVFHLNSSGNLRERGEAFHSSVTIRANGQGLWVARRAEPFFEADHYRSTFRLFDDAGLSAFMRRPALDVWRELQNALGDSTSDASFARAWTRKTEKQREDALWNWPHVEREPKRAEFQEWLRCALLCEDSLWQENEVWTLSVPDLDNIWLYSEEDWEGRPLPPELRQRVEQLWRQFAPFNDEVLTHECAFDWKQGRVAPFQAHAREPSAHQRLEAMLSWRDWTTAIEEFSE